MVGALEGHVLEHVREAGAAGGIVHRADVHIGVEGHHRRLMPFNDQEGEAVGQRELGDFFFEVLEGLGVGALKNQQTGREEIAVSSSSAYQ